MALESTWRAPTVGRRRCLRLAALAAVLFFPALAADGAPRTEIEIDPGPHYAGIPVQIAVVVEGFPGDAELSCTMPDVPPDVTLQLVGKRQNAGLTIRFNNRVRTSGASFTFVYQVVSEAPGDLAMGPFTITDGTDEVSAQPSALAFREVPEDASMRVAVDMPPGPFFVGQQVPVTVEWWYAGDTKGVNQLSIRSPLFDRFTFKDAAPHDGTRLPLATNAGRVLVNATVEQRTLNGRDYMVVAAPRTMLIDGMAPAEPMPLRATALIVTHWQRDGWGRSSPARVRPIRAESAPITLQIKTPPDADAPPGFGGAVGHGFAISAEADRSVVQVGDPITLTVTVRGDADMTQVALPPLDTGALRPGTGLNPEQFRLSDGAPAGQVIEEGRAKRFLITVRPLTTSINQIPPLLFSWFDPTAQRFETAACDPIALRVTAARMVGAQDVVAQSDPDPTSARSDDAAAVAPIDAAPASRVPAGPARHELAGADLSIEKNPVLLQADHARGFGGRPLPIGLYVAAVALLVGAVWLRRRDNRDPRAVANHKRVREQLRHIGHAVRQPQQEAAGQIAAALRQLGPLVDPALRADIDGIVADCDVMAYARGDGGAPSLDRALHDRVNAVVRRIGREKP